MNMDSVSELNFNFLSFPNIPCCIAILCDSLAMQCPTLYPPLHLIPNDPHDTNDPYNLCLKTNKLLGVYRDILGVLPWPS